jgi:Ca2+-binding RTX toxin-like protein
MTQISGTNGNDNLIGTSRNELIFGLDGDDTIVGWAGDDTINPGAGNDVVQARDGDDLVYAEIGDSFVDGGRDTDTVVFDFASTEITDITVARFRLSVPYDLTISTAEGSVRVFAFEFFRFTDTNVTAADVLTLGNAQGGGMNDTLSGDENGNLLLGLDGFDQISGLGGPDTLHGGNQNDTLYGGAGNDLLYGEFGSDYVFGGDGQDSLYGGGSRDYLTPGEGIDYVDGGDGIDTVILDFASTDVSIARLFSESHRSDFRPSKIRLSTPDGEELFRDVEYYQFTDARLSFAAVKQLKSNYIGTNGDDVLLGSELAGDVIFAWEGDDIIQLSRGPDTIGGWTGFDTIRAVSSAGIGVVVNLETGIVRSWQDYYNARLYSIEAVEGHTGNDHLTDSRFDNLLDGQGGNDTFLLRYGGTDTVDGGIGVDTLYYTFAANAGDLHVSLMDERGYAGHAEGDVIRNIENLYGSFGDDTLVGDDADNLLDGYAGSNVLTGMGGDDTLIGSAYRDDIAVYTGTRDDYSIEQSTNAAYDFVVRHTAAGGTDGTDHLLNIDILRFADGDLLL